MSRSDNSPVAFWLRVRSGFLLWLPLAILVNAVIGVAYSVQMQNQRQQWWVETENRLDWILVHLDEVRNDLHGDLSLLATSQNLKTVLEQATTESLDRLASEWEVFAAIKRRYDQIRWLDNQGVERLRINRTSQGARRVSEEQLQDKSDRYYFKQAIVQPAGQIYASPIDLNIEGGEIELPFKPILRLAMPLTDSGGGKRGLLVVNVLAGAIVEDLSMHAGLTLSHLLLIDPRGYYLRGYREDQAWGFMFDRVDQEVRFDKAHPQVWQQMVEQGHGRFESPRGQFLFRSMRYGTGGFSQRYFIVLAGLQAEFAALEQAQRPWWLLLSLLNSLVLMVLCLAVAHCLHRSRDPDASDSLSSQLAGKEVEQHLP